MSRASGSADLIGSIAYVESVRPRLLLSDKVFRLLVRATDADPRFLALALNARPSRAQIERGISGAGGLAQNITQETIKEIVIALPPRQAQEALVATLRHQALRLRRVSEIVTCAIARLREYRTALITAAVTGQIDVRGEAVGVEG